MHDEFAERNTVVIMVAQEDTDLESHGKVHARFEGPLPFEIVADLNAEQTTYLQHITSYLVDTDGKVREIFPSLNDEWPSWRAVLNRMDQILGMPNAK